MGGVSHRFAIAGYDLPKYLLPLGGSTVFRHAVGSFEAYFRSERFLFVIRDSHGTHEFVERESSILGIAQASIVALPEPTRGQAETVMLGLEKVACRDAEPVTIFNIDTFRSGFRYPDTFDVASIDGFLEVFTGSGANWSYVLPHATAPLRVARTSEKDPISDLCCTGLYHFRTAALFADAYSAQLDSGVSESQQKELYVAPLYNALIKRGCDIRYKEVRRSDVVFCGIPAEYESLRDTMS